MFKKNNNLQDAPKPKLRKENEMFYENEKTCKKSRKTVGGMWAIVDDNEKIIETSIDEGAKPLCCTIL